MTTVRVKDWCLDARDNERVAAFWSAALGLEVWRHPRRPGVIGLVRDDAAVMWVNPVDHDKVVKDRVHPDLHVPDVAALLALGATVHSEQDGFTVLADPEGHEMCAFPPPEGAHDGPPATIFAWCTDAARPTEVAAWWADRTGATIGPGPDGTPRYLHDVPGLDGVIWKLVPVDDERVVENRVHWDVDGDVAELVAAGATVVRRPDDDIAWTVMHDPDGNVFCCFTP